MSQQSTKGMPDAHELSIKIHFIKDCIGVEQALRQFQADTVAACAAMIVIAERPDEAFTGTSDEYWNRVALTAIQQYRNHIKALADDLSRGKGRNQ